MSETAWTACIIGPIAHQLGKARALKFDLVYARHLSCSRGIREQGVPDGRHVPVASTCGDAICATRSPAAAQWRSPHRVETILKVSAPASAASMVSVTFLRDRAP